MATIVGHGDYKYEIKENWAKLPDGWSFKEVAAVGVDRQDNVYCFTRGEHPVIDLEHVKRSGEQQQVNHCREQGDAPEDPAAVFKGRCDRGMSGARP